MSLRKIVTVGKDSELHRLAQQVGEEIFAADDLTEALDMLARVKPALVLFDDRFDRSCMRKFFNAAKEFSNVRVVAVGRGEKDTQSGAELIQMGAYDYLHGQQDLERLKQIVNRIENELGGDNSQTNTGKFFADDLSASASIVGRSEATLKTLKMIKLVAASRCNPVLIVGETGTGKELAASAIHRIRHPNGQFVAVNCASLNANLLESELFGHVKGSFTGADREKTGLMELAGNGTILLDEISEMPRDLQAKLLRVLQEKTFRKVGGIKNTACKATIIASSNRNLKRQMQVNRFAHDLYYRLDIFPITIAPLRAPERKEDIPLLAEYFLKTSTICPEKTNTIISITKLALEALQEHRWPGNVRELRNVIERAILLETTNKIGMSGIIIDSGEPDYPCHSTIADKIKDFSLEKAEGELIARALQETNWQKSKAAGLLGISRATLYAKVKQHNIEKGPPPRLADTARQGETKPSTAPLTELVTN